MRPLPSFSSRAFFAPMAGISDPALRLVCKELGAGLVVTEFTNIHAVVAREKDITSFVEFSPKERPLSIQLFGSDLDALRRAVKIVEPHFDIIDYNMGCPAPHITQQMACSALLQEPALTRKIFRTLMSSTTKPVTVKMRAGVSKPDRWKEIARIAGEEGLSMITFHPRTVKQGYSGNADWTMIKELKQMASIPVCGNGDVASPEDAGKMIEETGCDFVMIGRAACRNPFIFTQINQFLESGAYSQITPAQRLAYFQRYLSYTEQYPTIRFASIKMQAMNFTKGFVGGKLFRENLMRIKTADELRALLQTLL